MVCRFISNQGKWQSLFHFKYCGGLSLLEWIHATGKNSPGGSLFWKEIVVAFPIIGDRLVWAVGDGHMARIGKDKFSGVNGLHTLPLELIVTLAENG